MREPSLRTSRLVIASGLIAALVVGAAGFLAGRATLPRAAPAHALAKPEPLPPPSPVAPRVLGRADVLALAARYADAAASGLPPPPDDRALVGRRVELAIAFGCAGPDAEDAEAPLRWRYDAAAQTLRVHAAPQLWPAGEWGADLPLEGFWLSYPWTSADTCPAGAPGSEADESGGAEANVLAIARPLSGEPDSGSRAASRSFDIVKRLPADELDPARGFRLRLIGRLAAFPGGAPVRCNRPGGRERRPNCVVAFAPDEIGLESAGPAGSLGTWTPSQPEQDD